MDLPSTSSVADGHQWRRAPHRSRPAFSQLESAIAHRRNRRHRTARLTLSVLRTGSISILATALFVLLLLPGLNTSAVRSPDDGARRLGSYADEQERHLVREIFLKRFGLTHLSGAIATSANATPKRRAVDSDRLPHYVWDLYDSALERIVDSGEETIRHYRPAEVHTTSAAGGEGRSREVRIDYNLTTGGGYDAEGAVLTEAVLRLPLARDGSLPAISVDCEVVIVDDSWAEFNVLSLLQNHSQAVDDMISFHVTYNSTPPLELLNDAALMLFSEARGQESRRKGPSAVNSQAGSHRRSKRSVSTALSTSASSGERSQHSRRRRKHRHGGGRHGVRVGGSRSSIAHSGEAPSHLCRRTELYVDFTELNWQDWIVAPVGYEAYQCRGRCTHPMPSHLNTTNHAIIQSLLHSMDPSALPAPHCVPVQTAPISILYRDVNDVIVVKTYPEMRVEACGCL